MTELINIVKVTVKDNTILEYEVMGVRYSAKALAAGDTLIISVPKEAINVDKMITLT